MINTANEMKETLKLVIADCGKHLADMASGNLISEQTVRKYIRVNLRSCFSLCVI